MSYRYRDTATGRFTSKATWKRSKRQGGKRYKRERISQGWARGFVIRSGYDSHDNSYTLSVAIRPYKRLSDQDISNLIERLAGEGHFDKMAQEEDFALDLQWATFHNSFTVVRRDVRMKCGHAILIGFERNRP